MKTAPNYLKRIGDHCAELSLKDTDGVCTKPGKSGHFDFFEATGFAAVVIALEKLAP